MKIKLKALLCLIPLIVISTVLIPVSVVISSFGCDKIVEIILRPISAILLFIFKDTDVEKEYNKFD